MTKLMIVHVERDSGLWSYYCEYCGQKHYHGITKMSKDGFTHRVSNCIATKYLIHGYLLTEKKELATMPKYFSIIDEHVKFVKTNIGYQGKYNVIQKCLRMEYKEFTSLMTVTTKGDCQNFRDQMSDKYKQYTFKVRQIEEGKQFYSIDLIPLSHE